MCSLLLGFYCSWLLSEETFRRHTHTCSSFSRVPFSFPLFLFETVFRGKPGSHYPRRIPLLLGPPVYKVTSWPRLPLWVLVPPAAAQCAATGTNLASFFHPLPCDTPPPHLATTMLCCLPLSYEFLK